VHSRVSCLQAPAYPLLEKIILKRRVLLVEVGADLRVPVPPACAGAGQPLSRARTDSMHSCCDSVPHARARPVLGARMQLVEPGTGSPLCCVHSVHSSWGGRDTGGRALEDASIVVRRCLPYSV